MSQLPSHETQGKQTFEGGHEFLPPPPLRVEDPHPTRQSPVQKINLCVLCSRLKLGPPRIARCFGERSNHSCNRRGSCDLVHSAEEDDDLREMFKLACARSVYPSMCNYGKGQQRHLMSVWPPFGDRIMNLVMFMILSLLGHTYPRLPPPLLSLLQGKGAVGGVIAAKAAPRRVSRERGVSPATVSGEKRREMAQSKADGRKGTGGNVINCHRLPYDALGRFRMLYDVS